MGQTMGYNYHTDIRVDCVSVTNYISMRCVSNSMSLHVPRNLCFPHPHSYGVNSKTFSRKVLIYFNASNL